MNPVNNNSGVVRANHMIRVPNVRLIDVDGQQIGVLPTYEALRMAKEAGMDLVEVNSKTSPPVCKIMDFGKFKYEQKKREKEIARNQKVIETKQVNVRPTTDDHDLGVKANHVRRFLVEGDKVRIVVGFKGREISHPEMGAEVVKKLLDSVPVDVYVVEEKLSLAGKQMTMLIAPLSTTNQVAKTG